MPKMKTHKGTAKRFRRTGSGKIMRAKAFKSHILTKKSPKQAHPRLPPGDRHLSCRRQDRLPAHGFQLGARASREALSNEELIRYGTSQARRRRP